MDLCGLGDKFEVTLSLPVTITNNNLIIFYLFSAGGSYLYFANVVHLVLLQNVPSLRITTYRGGFNRVAVDFDKR